MIECIPTLKTVRTVFNTSDNLILPRELGHLALIEIDFEWNV